MALDTESFNAELYDLLKVRGYKPVPLNSQNQRVAASQEADVIEFKFIKDGKDYGKIWVTLDAAHNLGVYFDEEQQNSPNNPTPGVEYDDTWTGLLKHLKKWAQRRQISFELKNKDRLGDDMRQREYYKMKEKVAEGLTDTLKKGAKSLKRGLAGWEKGLNDVDTVKTSTKTLSPSTKEFVKNRKVSKGSPAEFQQNLVNREKNNQIAEGYYPMGKKASYNDAVPNVKIVIQHSRAIEEGEQRYRNVEKIFLENVDGERFLAPTTRPGIARVYARHIAEGGVPNDERWGHIKSICEEYNKMAGFVRATRGRQFNESAQALINEGANHYTNLRETLSRMTGHRGYNAYFESWTPTLMEDEGDETINELFVQETVDPRIESVMPILSRLHKNVTEVKEVDALAEWADGVINEKLLEMDNDIDDTTNVAQKKKNSSSKLDPKTVAKLITLGVIKSEEELEEEESRTSNNPQGIPEGDEFAGNFKTGPASQWRNKGPKANKPATVGDLVGGESKQNNEDPTTKGSKSTKEVKKSPELEALYAERAQTNGHARRARIQQQIDKLEGTYKAPHALDYYPESRSRNAESIEEDSALTRIRKLSGL